MGRSIEGCYVYVDGTDCAVQEPNGFNKKYYSHKLHSAGLRYEVGVTLDTGDIVWVHGPYPCGSFPDILIFRNGMKKVLDDGEKVLGDKGYRDQRCINPATPTTLISEYLHEMLANRHETVNKRLKQFFVLKTRFRHERSLHGFCFHAVANVTQYMMKHTPLYDVNLNSRL